MKKFLSVVLTLSMLIGIFAGSSVTFTAAPSYAVGDINMDGTVDTLDVRLMLRAIVGTLTLNDQQKELGDLNGDGDVTSSDAHTLLLVICGQVYIGNKKTVDLLAPSADSWYNPVQTSSGTPSIVAESAASDGGYTFKNIGGTWPYTLYIYDARILLPEDSLIEYDLTVNCASTSLNLFVGGATPDMNGDANGDDDDDASSYVKLNSLISSKNIDAGSGDLTKGEYKGTLRVGDLAVPNSAKINGMVWVSGIKIYAVGANGSDMTIRKLQVAEAYEEVKQVATGTNPEEAVRPSLVNSSEIAGMTTLTALRLYENGTPVTSSQMTSSKDNKKIYDTEISRRVINYADGYQMDLMKDWEPDYSLSALRSRYSSSSYVLTVSKEEENPYGNTSSGWTTYLTEWVNRYIADSSFLSANNLSYQRSPLQTNSLISGYTVLNYDIVINDSSNIHMPYYSIAIVRKSTVYNKFYLFVMKSSAPTATVIDRVLRSFKEVTALGTAVNSQGQYERVIPSEWSDETKAYYEKLCSQTTTDWGFFSASMVSSSDSSYSTQYNRISSEYDRLSTAMNYDYAIMPTYTHLRYGTKVNNFPSEMAKAFAGGNGFNGKPVLQFTYQFTTSNNTNLSGYTPMYDIMRGKFDSQFRQLAKDIKAYGKPVLLRLNNEMNTDWTSYAGIVTLLDPDIFISTWQRMYNIFKAEGVNNCIWIFNPIAKSTPYSSWGEDLCYMPGQDFVQIIGLTSYEMGNGTTLTSFEKSYGDLYQKNKNYYMNYPWVISEFACGAGGERAYDYSTDSWRTTTLGRNQRLQAQWVTNMFTCLQKRNMPGYEFCKNIKGAVWFSTNDYVTIDGTSYITNYLKLDSTLTQTLNAFKNGLA